MIAAKAQATQIIPTKQIVSQTIVASSPTEGKKEERTAWEFINDSKTKCVLNNTVNGGAAALAFFTFLNGNFRFFESIQEWIEPVSERLERYANALSGLIGGLDLLEKRNFFSLLGYLSMVPISLLFDSHNNWLFRGFSIGLNNSVFIIDNREIVKANGEVERDEKEQIKHLSGDFSKMKLFSGLWESIKVTCKESGKMLCELCQKPGNIKKFSHAILMTSLTQIISPFIAYFHQKIGSTIRNIAGVTNYVGLLLHKRKDNGSFFGINFKSPVVQCSLLRIGTSIFDFMKRFDFFSSRITNLTDISLALDRLAGARYSQGIFDIKKEKAA